MPLPFDPTLVDHPYLKARFEGIQQALIAHHSGGKSLPNEVIGGEREVFLREFLRKVFPSHFRFSTGVITDATGRTSGQLDCVIENPAVPSFPMPGPTEERLILAESVVAVIEIKSDLSGQWSQVRATTEKVLKLRRRQQTTVELEGKQAFFQNLTETIIPVIAVGYTGFKTVAALADRLSTTDETERPTAAFSIESGCFSGSRIGAREWLGFLSLCDLISFLLSEETARRVDLLQYGAQVKPS